MKYLVTGANGFIGKNLKARLSELGHEIFSFVRGDTLQSLKNALDSADGVFHLAGENRPQNISAFEDVNVGLTRELVNLLLVSGKRTPLIFTSSTQAVFDNPYGASKRLAERVLEDFADKMGSPVSIYRLPGVFGKWCRPNYNSVVANFCFNLANDLQTQINDPSSVLRLVYIDDVVSSFIKTMNDMCLGSFSGGVYAELSPVYETTVGSLEEQLKAFRNCRTTLEIERVGTGFLRALYSTYVSYLPREQFVYEVPIYRDKRGVFVEMLKTPDVGQFSYFTLHPGITRGGHYHHTKTEKFLVVKGEARFRFKNILTNDAHEIFANGVNPQVVDTVPGWAHDITNIGNDEMIVMLWANEIFDRVKPDTYVRPI